MGRERERERRENGCTVRLSASNRTGAGVHKARRAKLDRARKVREAEGKRVDEGEGENEHVVAGKGKGNKESCEDGRWDGDGVA